MHVSAYIVQAKCVRRFLLHLVRTASVRRGGLAVISCCSCLVVVFVPADAVYAAATKQPSRTITARCTHRRASCLPALGCSAAVLVALHGAAGFGECAA